jgi:pimeloyl-ACP methyl ester carboxylesterase
MVTVAPHRLYRINVRDEVLDDLRDRLARTRWPDEAEGAGWEYGVPVAWLRELCAYWRDEFDWRSVEARLNEWPQYLAHIRGTPIHYLHVRGTTPSPVPLLVTVGWPSTFAEVLPLLPYLTDFDVVVPTLPGFGFSSPYTRGGPRRVHDLWATLMTDLGYERFGATGSDIGARVTSRLGYYHPDRLLGLHLSSVDIEQPDPLPDDLTEAERDYLARVERWERTEGGYAHIQATAPQTLAYGLADSPAGLAAWIAEKFRAWSDCDGDVYRRFSLDDLLTTATIYWATGTINSANRSYYESAHDPEPMRLPPGTRIEVPTAIAMFPGEAELVVPRSMVERCYRVVRWTDMPRGGHFAAFEEPELLAADLRATFLG